MATHGLEIALTHLGTRVCPFSELSFLPMSVASMPTYSIYVCEQLFKKINSNQQVESKPYIFFTISYVLDE